jgi:uncharacterized protein (UPF0332 family)
MNYNKRDLISYRIEKAKTTFLEAKSLAANKYWNGAVNRLYYSCFYMVIALLAKDNIMASTHNGVRTEFFRNYIKPGLLNRSFSTLYSELMSKRNESDYDDFQEFEEEDIVPLFAQVEFFFLVIEEIIGEY